MGIKQIRVGNKDIHRIPVEKIAVIPGNNLRDEISKEHVAFLKASIRNDGFFDNKPLLVRIENDVAKIEDGEHRFVAVQELIAEGIPIESIPCVLEEKRVAPDQRLARQLSNNSGKPFTALEEGKAFQRLVGYGWTVLQIAEYYGKSRPFIDNRLNLMALHPQIRAMVRKGQLTVTAAQKIGAALVAQKIDEKTSLKMAQEIAQKSTPGKPPEKKKIEQKPRMRTLNLRESNAVKELYDLNAHRARDVQQESFCSMYINRLILLRQYSINHKGLITLSAIITRVYFAHCWFVPLELFRFIKITCFTIFLIFPRHVMNCAIYAINRM